jgi:hypothetical protein
MSHLATPPANCSNIRLGPLEWVSGARAGFSDAEVRISGQNIDTKEINGLRIPGNQMQKGPLSARSCPSANNRFPPVPAVP